MFHLLLQDCVVFDVVVTVLDSVQRVLGGHAPIGFQTPSRAYGCELIFGIEGVRKLD